ncbi:MAG TPA: efflux RND transporter periplasmic adaptor subunit [Desulfobacterales bacterium]|nr:efflux RND transporter periplasmic adaptor subunit [Desulfobacterales bacterium]
MPEKKNILKIILPLLILTAGIIAFRFMAARRHSPAKKAIVIHRALVKIIKIKRENRRVLIRETGIIHPRREVNISPQVSGRVVYTAPNLLAGYYFKKGDILFRIEAVDYKLAISRAQAEVAKMEYELAATRSKAQVARLEWLRQHKGRPLPTDSLALYGPQLKNSRAALLSAQAALKQAEINLRRTTITAPFNCRVKDEQIALGQYLQTNSKAATLIGTDYAEAVVPVPLSDLAWLRLPRNWRARRQGSRAEVRIRDGGRLISWPGRLIRSLSEVDQTGSMPRLIVEIPDPFNLLNPKSGRPALTMGMFADIIFKGKTAVGVYPIPVGALRDNNTVWLMNKEDKLRIIPVRISRRNRNEILISGGLKENERLIISNLAGAVDGMPLRLEDNGQL